MASELDTFINKTFTDMLGRRGFKKSGRTYRLTSPTGDQIQFNIRPEARQGPMQYFVLTVAVTPIIMLDYYHHTLGLALNRQLGLSDWFVTSHIASPQKRHSTYVPMYWSFEGEVESVEVSNLIRERLCAGLLDNITSLLDRRALLSLIREGPDTWLLPWIGYEGVKGEILILIQGGPSLELNKAIRQAEAEGDEKIVDWAKSYLDRHSD